MLLAALQRRAALKFPNFAINSSSTPSLPPFFRVFTSFRRINVTRSKYYSRKPLPIFFPRIRSQSIGSSRSRGIEKVNFLKNRRSLVLRASNYRIFARIPLLRSFHDHRVIPNPDRDIKHQISIPPYPRRIYDTERVPAFPRDKNRRKRRAEGNGEQNRSKKMEEEASEASDASINSYGGHDSTLTILRSGIPSNPGPGRDEHTCIR